jgi:hypothetical protein
MAEEEKVGSDAANWVVDLLLYALCLWVTWRVGGWMRGRFLGVIAVLISGALFLRGEQCRRETRRAGDFNTDFYIMVPFMCGVTLLLRVYFNHSFR